MTIKSIVVSSKPFKFNVGDQLFTCEFFGGKTLTVLSPVEINGGIEKVKVLCTDSDKCYSFCVGREDYIFPGDLGVPGFAYDDRKCSLFRSKKAANAHAGVYSKWLDRNPVELSESYFGHWYD
jgi:hypothetical protein